ncbi:MAG: ATP synthase F0 subunit A [Lentisphaerae bacterium RIFOXYC12_FULL_60_16]|nr:MAG: ATP synthase F0 subunit A [Lentisphaerae bacterium RIFOXYC12_FULL_60_16]OGV85064.1 MAG: ATP synthase F0 subunit A [Lentisphaerae bacterium RIFOXYB12_FULL_60_10]
MIRRPLNVKGVLLAAACLALAPGAHASEDIARELPVQIDGFGLLLEFNHATVMMTFVVAVLICALAWLCTRRLREVPGKAQVLFEQVFEVFDNLVTRSIGAASGRRYLPWIGSLFLFVWVSNMIGLLPVPEMHIGGERFNDYNGNGRYDPGEFVEASDGQGLFARHNGVYDAGFRLPAFHEPTGDYNVPLALALLFVVLIGHGATIRKHGLRGYLKGYFEPGGAMGIIMFPLNVVGKIAEVVSISFRLFGNIFGGVVILVVVSGLLHHLVLPVGLMGFFGVFAGTIQAFVFTMLALTYISLGVADAEMPDDDTRDKPATAGVKPPSDRQE